MPSPRVLKYNLKLLKSCTITIIGDIMCYEIEFPLFLRSDRMSISYKFNSSPIVKSWYLHIQRYFIDIQISVHVNCNFYEKMYGVLL